MIEIINLQERSTWKSRIKPTLKFAEKVQRPASHKLIQYNAGQGSYQAASQQHLTHDCIITHITSTSSFSWSSWHGMTRGVWPVLSSKQPPYAMIIDVEITDFEISWDRCFRPATGTGVPLVFPRMIDEKTGENASGF